MQILLRKKFIFFFSLCACLCAFAVAVRANNIQNLPESYIVGLDLTNGAISGERAEYTLIVPDDWLPHIIIEREELSPGTRILEMLNLYWQPQNFQPIFLASIYIYETQNSMDISSYRRILETDEYDIRIYISATDYDMLSSDEQVLHARFIEQLGDANFILELFGFPEGRGPVIRERLFINGRDVDAPVVHSGGAVFAPLRAVCEALGYAVIWYGIDQTIYIERNDFSYTLQTSEAANYGAVSIDNNYYVPVVFFMQVLQMSFDMDRRGNIFLTERI